MKRITALSIVALVIGAGSFNADAAKVIPAVQQCAKTSVDILVAGMKDQGMEVHAERIPEVVRRYQKPCMDTYLDGKRAAMRGVPFTKEIMYRAYYQSFAGARNGDVENDDMWLNSVKANAENQTATFMAGFNSVEK